MRHRQPRNPQSLMLKNRPNQARRRMKTQNVFSVSFPISKRRMTCRKNQGPLTPKEKYVLAWHQMFDFSAHFGNAFQSALQQASNGEPHYGQGWGAYGQRFAASEADQVTSSLLIFGVLPHLMKQDPRYFRKGKGSVWSRVSYAASRTVIARSDSGHAMFNYGQVFGQLGHLPLQCSKGILPRHPRAGNPSPHSPQTSRGYSADFLSDFIFVLA